VVGVEIGLDYYRFVVVLWHGGDVKVVFLLGCYVKVVTAMNVWRIIDGLSCTVGA
ncbi:hypothetical protein Dimus_018692, partial [Dionaea muscipula]